MFKKLRHQVLSKKALPYYAASALAALGALWTSTFHVKEGAVAVLYNRIGGPNSLDDDGSVNVYSKGWHIKAPWTYAQAYPTNATHTTEAAFVYLNSKDGGTSSEYMIQAEFKVPGKNLHSLNINPNVVLLLSRKFGIALQDLSKKYEFDGKMPDSNLLQSFANAASITFDGIINAKNYESLDPTRIIITPLGINSDSGRLDYKILEPVVYTPPPPHP